jgi:Xaa-Pro aminopeptidase
MRYQPLPPEFHASRRALLATAIGDDAIAVIDTADTLYRGWDAELPFRPDPNFYYLTGIDRAGAVLVLVPGHANSKARELLFIQPTDDFTAAWNGEGITQAEAAKLSGIETIYWTTDLEPILNRLLGQFPTVYLNADESSSTQASPSRRRAAQLHEQAPLHRFRSVLRILGDLRTIKEPVEIDQIRRAVGITGAGLKRAWSVLKPGLHEYAVEAELAAEYLRSGSNGHSFQPVVASGPRATVIHYMSNDARVGPEDLVLLDTGAEVGWYASDISRTVPASGRFTDRQRAVYEAVLRTQQAAIPLHKPGASILTIDEVMRHRLAAELADLGLLTKTQAGAKDFERQLRPFYSHISHHLGLDTHDTGDLRLKFKPGMVVTCEPGLYLKVEGIGVRLEDDILITDGEPEVLSRNIPSEPDELERP